MGQRTAYVNNKSGCRHISRFFYPSGFPIEFHLQAIREILLTLSTVPELDTEEGGH